MEKWLPKEKLQTVTHTAAHNSLRSAGSGNLTETLTGIPGLNIQAALIRMGGMESFFLNTITELKNRKADTETKIKTALEQNNFKELFIEMHNLKGLLGFIGADELFTRAGEIDIHIKQEDASWCQENLNAFIVSYDTLINNIEEKLKKSGSGAF
jgi:HPt (histidine-containing phosphotransfer) domain-containing protein